MNHKKENPIQVSYCGTIGSFSQQATARLFPEGKLLPCASFKEAYDLTLAGKSNYTVLPIENSYAGEVAATIDLLYRGKLFAIGLYDMRVEQCLVGVKGTQLSDVKTVISHPQALAQCAEYIASHHYSEIIAENTAFAAKAVADKNAPSFAAIASRSCAEIYGLEVLDGDISESRENTTRFALLSKEQPPHKKGEHIILLFSVGDKSGALAEALRIIAEYGYNMKSLHSRPLKDKSWQYYFYVEAEGNGDENRLVESLSNCCVDVKIAGRFLPDCRI